MCLQSASDGYLKKKLGQGNHIIIVTPSVSKSFVFKRFFVCLKTQSWRYEIFPVATPFSKSSLTQKLCSTWKWRVIIAGFQASSFLLNWKINCNDHSSLSSTTAFHLKYELFHIYFTFFQPATNISVARQVDRARWKTRGNDSKLATK